MSIQDYISLLGLSAARPAECCANCAFSNFSEGMPSCTCGLMQCYAKAWVSTYGRTPAVQERETCGVCLRWTPRPVALAARECASFDEFKLKREIMCCRATPELDDWFSEKKATNKMMSYMRGILTAADSSYVNAFVGRERVDELKLTVPPLVADVSSVTDDGIVRRLFTSNRFYTVQHWLSENAPAYEAYIEKTEKEKKKNAQRWFTAQDVAVTTSQFPTVWTTASF